MKNLIVLLISDQTIPNIEFIRSLDRNQKFDFLFITTELMETKGKTKLIKKLGIQDYESKIHKIETSHEDYETIVNDVADFIEKEIVNNYTDILINVTGGTKMMALATYAAFSGKIDPQCKFYYTSESNNIDFANIRNKEKIINKKEFLSVKECFQAFGNNNIVPGSDKIENQNLCEELFEYHVNNKKNEPLRSVDEFISTLKVNNISVKIEKCLDKYIFNYSKAINNVITPKLQCDTFLNYLSQIGYKLENNSKISNADKTFFFGGWFEDYTFNQLYNFILENDGDILKDISLNKEMKNKEVKKAENQIDVAIAFKNRLYIIENKFTVLSGSFLTEYIYKIEAINKSFGIASTSILATLDSREDLDRKEMNIKRLRDFNIWLICREDFINRDSLIQKMKNIMRINY